MMVQRCYADLVASGAGRRVAHYTTKLFELGLGYPGHIELREVIELLTQRRRLFGIMLRQKNMNLIPNILERRGENRIHMGPVGAINRIDRPASVRTNETVYPRRHGSCFVDAV